MLTSASGVFIDFPIGKTIMVRVLHLSFILLPTQLPLNLAPGQMRDLCTVLFLQRLHSGILFLCKIFRQLTPQVGLPMVEFNRAFNANRLIVQGFQYCHA